MTGEQALQCMELTLLRQRDRQIACFPRDEGLINVLDAMAKDLAEFQLLERCAREARHAEQKENGK